MAIIVVGFRSTFNQGGMFGSFGEAFEGLLEGGLGYSKANALVMSASTGA